MVGGLRFLIVVGVFVCGHQLILFLGVCKPQETAGAAGTVVGSWCVCIYILQFACHCQCSVFCCCSRVILIL